MKTMSNIRPFYPKLVKEFIVNLPKDINDAGSIDFKKVHVIGYSFGFSGAIINEYLGRGKLIIEDMIPQLKIIAHEIT